VGWEVVEAVKCKARIMEEEHAQYFLGFIWDWELLMAQVILPLIGAGLRAKPLA
jgi:hypothetical protein